MNKNPISDTVFEALFRQAVIDDYIDEVESAPPKEELAKLYPISPEFDLRMKKFFDYVRRKDFFINFSRYAKRAAVILIVVSNISFTILLTAPEVRAAIGNVVVEWFEKFTAIIYYSETTEEDRKAVIMVLSCSSLSVMASANPKNSTDKMTFDEYVVYLTEIATTEA